MGKALIPVGPTLFGHLGHPNVLPHSQTSMSYESNNFGIYFNLLDVYCFLSVKLSNS